MSENKKYKGIVAIIINAKDGVLMGKKVERPGHFLSNQWHIPGGKVDEGEDVEETLKREMLEELGVDLEIVELLCDYPVEVKGITYLSACYICKQIDPKQKLQPADDLQDAKYFPKDKVKEIHQQEIIKNWPVEMKEYFGIE